MSKLRIFIICIAVILFLVSAGMFGWQYFEYEKAINEYSALNMYVKSGDTSKEGASEEDSLENILKENKNRSDFPDLTVDFEGLKKVNKDVAGWIYVGFCGTSYPYVQGTDNEYYLHHTVENTENLAGAVFLDSDVKKDLTDFNTFIYGHNMKNGTMFGSLKKLIREENILNNDPYIYIFLEGYIYRYKIYSYYLDSPDSDMYRLCENEEEYDDYLKETVEKSVYKNNEPVTIDNNILTLVTCSGVGSNKKRLFIHGIFEDRYVFR